MSESSDLEKKEIKRDKNGWFKKGHSANPGGRKSKKNLLDVPKMLSEQNFDPVIELISLFHGADTTTEQRINICKEFLKYAAVTYRAVEFNAQDAADKFTFNMVLNPSQEPGNVIESEASEKR